MCIKKYLWIVVRPFCREGSETFDYLLGWVQPVDLFHFHLENGSQLLTEIREWLFHANRRCWDIMRWHPLESHFEPKLIFYSVQQRRGFYTFIIGGFLKWWYPTTMGFPTENDHFGVLWGYHHLRKHPMRSNYCSSFTCFVQGQFRNYIQTVVWCIH